MNALETRSGFVAIVGRPNVGKSTLLNILIKRKLSITADKPQTTRHQITGIWTEGDCQVVFVDTPGLHSNAHQALNRYMNTVARQAFDEVDCIIWVVDRLKLTGEDQLVLSLLQAQDKPVICVLNKVDLITDKTSMIPHLSHLQSLYPFDAIVPLSARKAKEVDRLRALIKSHMPIGPHYYEAQDYTNRPLRFQIAEIIREKLTRLLGQELPYALTVEIDSFEQGERLSRILATIFVERASQRPIILGQGGLHLRDIATKARIDIETLLDKQVYLKLWVKVKESWSDDLRALKSLGYDESV